MYLFLPSPLLQIPLSNSIFIYFKIASMCIYTYVYVYMLLKKSSYICEEIFIGIKKQILIRETILPRKGI